MTSKARLALVALLCTGAACSPVVEGEGSTSGDSQSGRSNLTDSESADSESADSESADPESADPESADPESEGAPEGLQVPGLGPPTTEWLRVDHDDFPISFEVPDGTSRQRENVFSLGRPRRDDRSNIDAVMYGVRTLGEQRIVYHAVQFAFFWVTDDVLGADAGSIRALHRATDDPIVVRRFLQDVFYSRLEVSLIDLGRDVVDGHLARRTAIVWRVAGGTPDERTIEGEAFVVPISERDILVAIARFDAKATQRERAEIFLRVVHSLAIGAGLGPLEARYPPGRGLLSPPAT